MEDARRRPRGSGPARLLENRWIGPAIAVLIVAGVAFQLQRGLAAVREADQGATALGRMVGQIRYLDEVLSMSTHMAAATGEARWELRYRLHEPRLTAAIDQARGYAGTEQGLLEVDGANATLLGLEQRAFAAVRAGDQEEASRILDGSGYRHEKQRYEQGLRLATAALRAEADRDLVRVRAGLITGAALAGLIVLALLLAQRTVFLGMRAAKQELLRGREVARAAELARSQLLTKVGRELRAPLNVIFGAVADLGRTELGSRQGELLSVLQAGAVQLRDLIEDTLDAAEVEAGQGRLVLGDVDLREVVQVVRDQVGREAESKGITVLATVEAAVPKLLRGDPQRFRQVLSQLVSNAVAHSERGQVSIRVELDRHVQDQVHIRVHIRDTGMGVEGEALSTVFEGELVQAQRLANLMGGELSARSAPGQGSTLTFTSILRSNSNRAPQTVSLSGQRALLVDAGSAHLRAVWELMLSWGAHTERVGGLAEAREALDSAIDAGRPFRFVLFDLVDERTSITDMLESLGGAQAFGFLEPDAIPPVLHPHLTVMDRPVREADLMGRLGQFLDVQDEAAQPISRPRQGAPRVLVIEDNQVNQQVVERHLRCLGCEVDLAADGSIGLERLGAGSYDLVLMDCQMPVLDGYETTRELRRRESHGEHITVVALTANVLDGNREKCLLAGMDDFMGKPVQREELRAMLTRWVSSTALFQ